LDTKSRNKLQFITMIILLAVGMSGTIFALLKADEYLNKDYFHSEEFESRYNQFLDTLSMYDLHSDTAEDLKKNIPVTKEDIEEHRYRYGSLADQTANIKAQYESRITDARTAENDEVAKLYELERDKKIADIANNFKNDEYVRKKILKEKEKRIDKYFRELEINRREFENNSDSFIYYLKNTETGEIHTNIPNPGKEAIKDLQNSKGILFSQNYSGNKQYLFNTQGRYLYLGYDDVVALLKERGNETFEGIVALPKTTSSADPIMVEYRAFHYNQLIYYGYSAIGLLTLIIGIFLFKKTAAIKAAHSAPVRNHYEIVPVDARILLFIASLLCTYLAFWKSSDIYIYPGGYFFVQLSIKILTSALLLTITLVQGGWLIPMFSDIERLSSQIKRGFIYKSWKSFQLAFLHKSIGIQMLLLIGIMFATGFGVGILILDPGLVMIYLILFVIVTVPTLFVLLKKIGYFNKIVNNSSELVRGNLEPDLPIQGKSVLAALAANINTLKYGVKASQKAQAKSERLKTELITNVSHDLRTPLTSIITYTELLKTEDLPENDRNSYLQIIDRKSKRLKVLIDDLFEASKMASGNIELVKDKVDIVQLLQQALAEYDETLKESSLQLRVTAPDKPVYAFVDGQKLWRVFDNLIGNILKYSMDHTRVYITLTVLQHQAEIIFKNVSKYELGDNTEELLERFKRGDTSRQTDGSGLGLAIAKSIVDLHDGNFEIEADGDLFKVTVLLDTIT
jgi:signal transduction histidine kinase